MKSMMVASPELKQAAIEASNTLSAYTADAVVVRLVEGTFDPADPGSWPAPSSHFTSKTSGISPTVEYDAASESWYVVWPDPTGGWDYVSASVTDPVTITGYTVKNGGGDAVGAATIPPVAVAADGQHIVLPFIALGIGQQFTDADVPVTI